MSAIGLYFTLKRIGAGDPRDLFYELKEVLCSWVWNVTSSLTGFQSYLGSDEFDVWMSDRWDVNEEYLYFAFWEQGVEEPLCDYAMHVARLSVAESTTDVNEIGARHGFAIDLSDYATADVLRGDFAMHSSSRVCRVLPWRRGESIDAMPRFACAGSAPHRAKPPSGTNLHRIRACAMTGLCACTRCAVARGARVATSTMIPVAWQALDRDRIGQELAEAAAGTTLDATARAAFGAWLESQGVALDPDTRTALAERYTNAVAIDG